MSTNEEFGRTIQLFLVDGKPSGLRKATIHGWTGLVFVCGASAFGELSAREEVDRTGVYILTGPDPEKAGGTLVYIGEGNSVSERIQQSALEREFWETAITVTTSDDDLSKGHVEYLEARLIAMTGEAGRVRLDNSKQPDIKRRRLPEADKANMEQFLRNLNIVFPVIGLDMLKPQPRAVSGSIKTLEDQPIIDVQFEMRHRTGVKALAVEEESEFIVLEGSEALTDTGYAQQGYGGLKEKLISDGVLVPHSDGKLKFQKSWPFKSPSAAAAIVLDRNSNGRTEWKVKGHNQNYHEWQKVQAHLNAEV